MRIVLRCLLSLFVLLGPLVGRASAVTIQELLDYKDKLSDDILIALIESDGSVFHLSIGDVAALRDKGLSERVILAMLKTAKRPVAAVQPAPEPVAPAEGTPVPGVYFNPTDQSGAPVETMEGQPAPAHKTTAPVVVNVKQEVTQHVDQPAAQPAYPYGYPYGYPSYYGGVIIGAPIVTRPVLAPAPVYWGWGGQRRPDSWQPLPSERIQPKTVTTSPKTVTTSPKTVTTPKGGGGV